MGTTALGGANGAGAAARSADGRWEFMLQSGRTAGQDQPEFLRYLCRQLEATTINTMLQAARRATPEKGLLSGGFAGSMFQSMADEEYSRMLAARGGFGLGDMMFKQMDAMRAYRQTDAAASAAAAGAGAGNGPQGATGKSDN
jgi:Rod binding domain-containing protein